MKTNYEEIVNVSSIGDTTNPLVQGDLLSLANKENLSPSAKNPENILVIGIDFQNDFMENGSLGVPGAHKDVENFTRFIYNNMDKISRVAVSIDTHNPFQIFHPCWWVDENGDNPAPLTAITLDDLNDGKWKPVINPIGSRDYVENLEKLGKKVLVIWPYHCLQGTQGAAIENQLTNMIYFYSVAKKSAIQYLVKGQDPMSEMYGILKPEYSPKNQVNIDFLNKLEKYDKIIIGGEAKDFCVIESIKQILEHYETRPDITSKIYILEDCTSTIIDKAKTNDDYEVLKKKYNINIVKSTEMVL